MVLPNVSYVKDGEVYYNPEPVISYVAVDLGLPSGTLWADRNIGATSPEDDGLYFQWGDTVGYTPEQVANGEKIFNWDTYFDTTDGGSTFNKYTPGKLSVLEASDDAATVNMGSDWRMPTYNEISELMSEMKNNTILTFIDRQGNEFSEEETKNGAIKTKQLKGVRFTGSNGNSIFIPASGFYNGESRSNYVNEQMYMRSQTVNNRDSAIGMFIHKGGKYSSSIKRYFGIPVRAVKKI